MARWGALLVLVLTGVGCGAKVVGDDVVRTDQVWVRLRHTEDGGAVVPRGYAHPATVADVRLAHILASFSHQDGDEAPRPTIRTDHVYPLAEALSQAFERAGPDDEIVAATFSRDRRLSIFTEERVTAFRTFMRGDTLEFEFYAVEEIVARGEGRARDDEYEIPTELPRSRPAFRLVPGDAQANRGARGLSVDWRDPYYRSPVSLRARYGELRRRTTLMEMSEDEVEQAGAPMTPPPSELTSAQLRALDELEAARRAGYVTEAEYRRRHRLVVENRLEEAGYPPEGQ